MKKIFVLLLMTALLLTLIMPITVYAAESDETIRVGWYYTGEGDTTNGYSYEYLQALSQYTGWKYEYVEDTWENCLEQLEKGQIDILGFVQKTEELEQLFAYPSLPMATTSGYLVTGSQSTLTEEALAEKTPLRVGVVKGNAFNKDFEAYRSENGINAYYAEFSSLADISPALERGDIDVAVVAEEDKTESEQIIVRIASYNQYFVTDIDNQALLRELDSAMVQVNTYCPYVNNDLYQKYLSMSTNGKPIFTQAEQTFILEHPQILVLYDSGWPPVEYLDDESGTYRGISPDLFALLTEKCGVEFVYEGSTSGEVLEKLKNGEQNNVLTTISYDYTWADTHDVFITQPFITSSIVKLGHHLNNDDAVIAINEKAFFTYLLQNELEGKITQNYKKQAERLEAVRTGKADYTYVTEDQANYYRSIPKYADLEVERMVGYEQKICISIEKNSSPELLSIISKSLASITHDEMTEIITKNTVSAYQLTFADRLYQNRVTILVVSVSALIILAVLIFFAVIRHKAMQKIKVAYKQKEEALLVAEKASAAKGTFMSRMSHEIRTPLNAVIGYNTIARNDLTEVRDDATRKQAEMKVMDCLTKSDIASKHLLTIINDVLDMSAIESGKIKVAHEQFDFKGLITSLTTIFYSQARAKDVDFDVIFDTTTDEWLVGDQMRTNQILTNLISNAVKFTPENGQVRMNINRIAEDEKSSVIRFTVTDTGIGMTQEYLSHLWTPFEQADSSISRRFGGTGLGLSITKNLVELMNGRIEVQSRPGEGTTFTVELSFEKAHLSSAVAYDFSGINALVVDDDISTCDYVRLLLNRCGTKCATALSGADAIEAFYAAEKNNNPFNLCLVDWRMPKMNGIETIKRIREIAGNELPIIVLTAYDFSELADKAAEVGVSMFVSKPLFQSSLFDLLANINGKKAVSKIQRDEKVDFNGARVLLAEDNAMNMEIASKILESAGIVVESAWNGEEAVRKFMTAPAGTFKCILMDVQMPVMDGYQATHTIRSSNHPEAAVIPIIAMTADAFAENIAESRAVGMNDHISKPIDVASLFRTLKQFIC